MAVCVILTHTAIAQEKTGNIVEYFGKEKVNDVSEGDVLHVFNKGLTLMLPRMGFNSSSFPEDPVFSAFLESDLAPTENDVFYFVRSHVFYVGV